jgi:DNA-binding CsgD family transcriptional regulator
MKEMYDALVIGLGLDGTCVSLEIAQKNHRILAVSSDKEILDPQNNHLKPYYRLHSGLSYIGDTQTAKTCLINSMSYAKKWPDSLLTSPCGNHKPYCIYYITSNSLVSLDQAKEVVSLLKSTYREYVKQNPANKVFGEPNEWIQEINPENHALAKKINWVNAQGIVESITIVAAFKVIEPQIDISKMKNSLSMAMDKQKNIDILFNSHVITIEPSMHDFSYRVQIKNQLTNQITEVKTKAIVNCSRQIPGSRSQLPNFIDENEPHLLTRIKNSLLVELPHSLKNLSSCVFASGPHCAFINLYNGTAILTYEPIIYLRDFKNLESIENNENVSSITQLINQTLCLDSQQGKQLAATVIAGCSQYIPALQQAQPKKIQLYCVRLYGEKNENYSLYSTQSPIHRRREDGIMIYDSQLATSYISALSLKISYVQSNAEKISQLIQMQFEHREHWTNLLRSFYPKEQTWEKTFQRPYKLTFDKQIHLDEIKSEPNVKQVEPNEKTDINLGFGLLSQRELECIQWLYKGKTVPEIALILNISKRTAEKHILNIKNKLQCYTLLQLGAKLFELGLLKP